jgi:hypothetical protein
MVRIVKFAAVGFFVLANTALCVFSMEARPNIMAITFL